MNDSRPLTIAVVLIGVSLLMHGIVGATAQQATDPSNVSVPGPATLTLADDVASTGAVTGVDTGFVETARCLATFSSSDNANDADLEGTVDGTTWHLIDTADPDGSATFLLDDTTGPWDQLRVNVVALGTEITVDVVCLATVRQ